MSDYNDTETTEPVLPVRTNPALDTKWPAGSMARWFATETKPAAKARTRFSDVYQSYRAWCTAADIEPMSAIALGSWMTDHGYEPYRSNGVVYRTGFSLINPIIQNDGKALKYGRRASTLDNEDQDDTPQYLVQGLIPMGTPIAIHGPPKSKKTFVAIDIALSIAIGAPWCHVYGVKRGRVLLLLLEDPISETRRRIRGFLRYRNITPSDLDDWLFYDDRSNRFRFDEPGDMIKMHMTLADLKPSLVVMDSLSRLHSVDENSKKEMSIVTDGWAELCASHGCSLAVIHHNRKSDGQMRGTGDILALVRGTIGVDRGYDGTSRISVDGNLSEQADPFTVQLVDGKDQEGKPTLHFEHHALDESKVLARKVLEALGAGPKDSASLLASTKLPQAQLVELILRLSNEGRVILEDGQWRAA